MGKKGFTLVELMVVIVIIGVLAAVAIPRMVAATHKARAAEGPQILGTISNLQHAFRAEYAAFATCAVTASKTTASGGWSAIGMDVTPFTDNFSFQVAVTGSNLNPIPAPLPSDVVFGDAGFTATANLRRRLGDAAVGSRVTVNELDVRQAGIEINKHIGSFGATGVAALNTAGN